MQNPFRTLTPAEMLSKQLDAALRGKIASAEIAEEHASHVQMLNARIARIQRELKAMTTQDSKEPQCQNP